MKRKIIGWSTLGFAIACLLLIWIDPIAYYVGEESDLFDFTIGSFILAHLGILISAFWGWKLTRPRKHIPIMNNSQNGLLSKE